MTKRVQTEFPWRCLDCIFYLNLRRNTCSHNSSLLDHETENRLVNTFPNLLGSGGNVMNIVVGAEQMCDLELVLFQLVFTMQNKCL